MSTLVRVINQQLLKRSILIDKVDRSQGQFETGISYAQVAKQKIYVPYANPLDPTVKGYIDMVPTDDVLMAMNGKGSIARLTTAGGSPYGWVTTTLFNSSLTTKPTVTAGAHTPVAGATPSGSHLSIAAAVAGVPVTRTGTNAQAFNNSAPNANKLNIRASAHAAFTQITTTASSLQTAAQIVSDLNAGFVANSLPFVAAETAAHYVSITSTASAATAYMEMSVSSPSAGTLSTVLGLTVTHIFGRATALVTDATAAAWTAADIGNDIIIAGGGNVSVAANAGTFEILDYVSTSAGTQVYIANAAAAVDGDNGSIVWSEATEATVNITGTTFLSLAPDHTYVILTNNVTKAKQTISDSAIIAAGAPNVFSSTSIVIDNALITIGTPTAGWKIQVQANSKLSATFTCT